MFLCNLRAAEIEASGAGLGDLPGYVRLHAPGADEVQHLVSSRVQELRDQAPMALRPAGLGPHQRRRRLGQRGCECGLPALGAHSGGVGAERRHVDAPETLLTRLAREASAELDRVPVADSGRGEACLERIAVELGVPARTG